MRPDPEPRKVQLPWATLVGTGVQIATGGSLESGIWQTADGTYRGGSVWTGQTTLQTPGTSASTCGDWSDPLQTAANIGSQTGPYGWWQSSTTGCRATSVALYCIEIPATE